MQRKKLFLAFALLTLGVSSLVDASNPIRSCKKSDDCILLNNPRCKDEYNKISVNKKHKKKIGKRRCKKTDYQFNDSDSGFSMAAECVEKQCEIIYKATAPAAAPEQ